jgi:hypothetical protein
VIDGQVAIPDVGVQAQKRLGGLGADAKDAFQVVGELRLLAGAQHATFGGQERQHQRPGFALGVGYIAYDRDNAYDTHAFTFAFED